MWSATTGLMTQQRRDDSARDGTDRRAPSDDDPRPDDPPAAGRHPEDTFLSTRRLVHPATKASDRNLDANRSSILSPFSRRV